MSHKGRHLGGGDIPPKTRRVGGNQPGKKLKKNILGIRPPVQKPWKRKGEERIREEGRDKRKFVLSSIIKICFFQILQSPGTSNSQKDRQLPCLA